MKTLAQHEAKYRGVHIIAASRCVEPGGLLFAFDLPKSLLKEKVEVLDALWNSGRGEKILLQLRNASRDPRSNRAVDNAHFVEHAEMRLMDAQRGIGKVLFPILKRRVEHAIDVHARKLLWRHRSVLRYYSSLRSWAILR